jgi:putative tributyrin esterase
MRGLVGIVPVLAVAIGAACAGSASRAATPGGAAAAGRPTGTVHEDLFRSEALGVEKHLAVYLPPSYGRDPARRFPVVYYLHGLGGTETDWLSKGSIDVAADSLFASGAPEMIIVMPDGDDGWYTTWVEQIGFSACADTLRSEAANRYCVAHRRYDDYIARDVVRHVDSAYRTLADGGHRGIAGLSMGGYGALSIALRYPDVFGAAASHSGVVSPLYAGPRPFAGTIKYAATVEELRPVTGGFWAHYRQFWGTDLERWRMADPAHVAELRKQRGLRFPALYLDCGRDDAFIDQNRALHFELDRLGVTHTYAEFPGAHSWRYWSGQVGRSLGWLAKQVGN